MSANLSTDDAIEGEAFLPYDDVVEHMVMKGCCLVRYAAPPPGKAYRVLSSYGGVRAADVGHDFEYLRPPPPQWFDHPPSILYSPIQG